MAEGAAAKPSRGEAQPSSAEDGERPRDAGRPAWKRRRTLLIVAGIAAVVVLGVVIYLLVHAGKESTDDAQIDADLVPLAPRVAGKVVSVAIVENQAVRKGDLILQLDDRNYQARLAQASAEVDSARAQADAAASQVAVAEAGARGSLTEAESGLLGSVGVARLLPARGAALDPAPGGPAGARHRRDAGDRGRRGRRPGEVGRDHALAG